MNYPETRLRRLRYNKIIREMFEDIKIFPQDLIYPIFICEGQNIKNEIKSLDGQFQMSIDNAIKLCKNLLELKINKILLFGVVSKKDDSGEIACNSNSIVPQAISKIKEVFGNQILIIADICNCSYTNHGHCGTIKDNDVDNDLTNITLANQSLIVVKAGADVIAPSDMMDGRVKIIRDKLDQNGYEKIPIFPYSVKYSSSFYGPFRNAVGSNSSLKGDKKTYQMDYSNFDEAIREVALDVKEGTDMVMVKPGMPYLDIIRSIKENFKIPVLAYQVSGEYSMLHNAVNKKIINNDSIYEVFMSFKRAGANAIISYYADRLDKILKQ